jgi:hypothetical protein
MIKPITLPIVKDNRISKFDEQDRSYAYFAWQCNRIARKKSMPLWCRDPKKIPSPKIISNNFFSKLKSFLGGD